jgi:predicted nucleic acid-binding protein
MVRTFLDAGVFLTAHDAGNEKSGLALQLFESPDRELVATNLLRLEIVPQAAFHKQRAEIEFYEACFGCISVWVDINKSLIAEAEREASRFGLHAIDALHIAAALKAGAEEFITTERVTKPLFRVSTLRVIRLDSLT